MFFVVHAYDRPDALALRLAQIADHRSYLDTAPDRHGILVMLSGPLTEDSGDPMKGSFFLLQAPDRASIEALFDQDPLMRAGIWQEVHIDAVTIRQNHMDKP